MNKIMINGIVTSKVKIGLSHSASNEIPIATFIMTSCEAPYRNSTQISIEVKCLKPYIMDIINKITKNTEVLISGVLKAYQKENTKEHYVEADDIIILPQYIHNNRRNNV